MAAAPTARIAETTAARARAVPDGTVTAVSDVVVVDIGSSSNWLAVNDDPKVGIRTAGSIGTSAGRPSAPVPKVCSVPALRPTPPRWPYSAGMGWPRPVALASSLFTGVVLAIAGG